MCNTLEHKRHTPVSLSLLKYNIQNRKSHLSSRYRNIFQRNYLHSGHLQHQTQFEEIKC